jgi:hypothetical protein
LQKSRWFVSFRRFRFGVFCLGYGILCLGLGGRDARSCVPGVRSSRCPASALICFESGPLGDASGNFSLVLASVNVVLLTVVGVMCAPLR